MMLINITEPNEILEKSTEPAIGIDLGTTNSLVGVVIDGKVEIIDGLLPSIVSYLQKGEIIVGREEGNISIKSVKRLLNLGNNALEIGNKKITPIEISAEILKALKKRAEDFLGNLVTKAVITVPAYFDENARSATKLAAKLAGLEVLRLINEPTAAALAYGLDNNSEGKYLIYDLGGGTFDISLLNMTKGVFQVLATKGDTKLGGDDIDHIIAQYFLNSHPHLDLTPETLRQIHQISCLAKEKLSINDQAEIIFKEFKTILTKVKFEELIEPMIDKTINLVLEVLEESEIDLDELKGIVLVGGSSRINLISKKLKQKLNHNPLTNLDPDKIVAIGATLQAEGLVRGSDDLLVDVTPLSLGIEIMGGLTEKIITRNSVIPASVEQEFTTYIDGQTNLSIHIVQGERELVKDCRSLGKLELKNIPPMKAGLPRISIRFVIDTDGLLTVSAYEKQTGQIQHIEIKPSYGMSFEEIEKMLIEAMDNAELDALQKLLFQTKLDTIQEIEMLEFSIKEDKELLENEDEHNIKLAIAELKSLLENNDREAILVKVENMHNKAENFLKNKMNKYLGKALEGQTINQIETMIDNKRG